MARTQPERYFKWPESPIWQALWLATPKATRVQWERVCDGTTDSTYAVVAAIARTINQQAKYSPRLVLNDPSLPIINFLYIEWRIPGLQLIWPYGTLYMPIAVSGQAVSGNMISNMDYENGIFPEELLGKKWQE